MRPISLAKYRWLAIGIAIVGYIVDQVTKIVAVRELADGQSISLIANWFTLRLVFNPGAAFSLGTNFTVVLSVLSMVVFVLLVAVVLWRIRDWLAAVAVGLLLFGVAGNLTDRIARPPGIMLGHVVDFISVRGFAVFNVADIGITCAAGLLIIWALRSDSDKRRAEREHDTALPADSSPSAVDQESDS